MNKRCLILGASGDIGRATTWKLVQQGYQVGVQYHANETAILELEAHIPSAQYVRSYQADLSITDGIYSFLKSVDDGWDAVVFCGGHMWSGLFQDMTMEDMDRLYNVHVKSMWMISKHLLPHMIRQKDGNIVVVSSIFGVEGASLEVAYSSVKGAQISFVKSLAKEVAPSGIRVNAVAPGLIATKMNAHLSNVEMKALEEDIPLGRAGKTNEVSDAIHFLLSEKSSYMTGQTLQVDGGWR